MRRTEQPGLRLSQKGFNHDGIFLYCVSKSKSLSGSVSKSNFIYGSSLKKLSPSFFIRVLFLAARKVPKEPRPCGLAFGCPRANAFFSAGRNSPACGGAQTACPLYLKKPSALGCAAKGGGTVMDARPAINRQVFDGCHGPTAGCPCFVSGLMFTGKAFRPWPVPPVDGRPHWTPARGPG